MNIEKLVEIDIIKHFEKKGKLIDEYVQKYGGVSTWTCETRCSFAYDWGCAQR